MDESDRVGDQLSRNPPARTFLGSTSEPSFLRARHLLFALLGLFHGPLAMHLDGLLPLIVAYPGAAEFDTIARLASLCFAAFVAWLAFAVFETDSDITILPRRWRDAVGPSLLFTVFLLVVAAMLTIEPPSRSTPFVGPLGELLVGWLVLSMLAGAAAEELVYRALLLRALEGYMKPWYALGLQALVFELVHLLVYGYEFAHGFWFLAGLIYGHAFQRTRSIAVPTVLHAAYNITFYTLVWYPTR
ncbi:MAG: type II CAAX endopeptidase family protein [Enhygromyxa sp.]